MKRTTSTSTKTERERCTTEGQRQFPSLPWGQATDSSLGWDNIVLAVGEEWIFRFPRTLQNARQLEKETRFLPLLSSCLHLAVPSFHFVGKGHAGVRGPFVGYRRLPGEPLSLQRLDPSKRPKVAQALGRLLSDLARIPIREVLPSDLPGGAPEAWRRGFVRCDRLWSRTLLPQLPPDVRRRVREDWAWFESTRSNFEFTPVVLHRDLGPDHILWDGERVSGIIDWGDACIGDPAFELTGLGFLGRRSLDAIARGRANLMGRDWQDRVAFYRRRVPQIHAVYARGLRDLRLFESNVREIRASYEGDLRYGRPERFQSSTNHR
ncbi:MAG: phosphotransferase [Euryarchaeota archaeon]|nr:phosphotransferase [Euryarchaeota archaeon]MDE2046743.1 phosphotransferase [Thermoplasmata archaeon]